jgi:hypothetical protein
MEDAIDLPGQKTRNNRIDDVSRQQLTSQADLLIANSRNFGHLSVASRGRRCRADEPRASQRPGTRDRVMRGWCVMCQDTKPASS